MIKIETKSFEIENLTPQICDLTLTFTDREYTGFNNNYLVIDFGVKSKGDYTTCNLMYRSKNKITSTSSSCGCTNPTFQNTEDDGQFVTVAFDTNQVARNVSKWFQLHLKDGGVIKMNLIINN